MDFLFLSNFLFFPSPLLPPLLPLLPPPLPPPPFKTDHGHVMPFLPEQEGPQYRCVTGSDDRHIKLWNLAENDVDPDGITDRVILDLECVSRLRPSRTGILSSPLLRAPCV